MICTVVPYNFKPSKDFENFKMAQDYAEANFKVCGYRIDIKETGEIVKEKKADEYK